MVLMATQCIKPSSGAFPIAWFYNLDRQKSVHVKMSSHPQFYHVQMVNEMMFLKIVTP